MCVCCVFILFVGVIFIFILVSLWFFINSKIFLSMTFGDVTITIQDLQILTCTRHSWSLRSEGSLKCRTYSDTGQPFIMIIKARSRIGAQGVHPLLIFLFSFYLKILPALVVGVLKSQSFIFQDVFPRNLKPSISVEVKIYFMSWILYF